MSGASAALALEVAAVLQALRELGAEAALVRRSLDAVEARLALVEGRIPEPCELVSAREARLLYRVPRSRLYASGYPRVLVGREARWRREHVEALAGGAG